MPEFTLTTYATITVILGLVTMLASNLYRSENHPGFKLFGKKGERKPFWETRDWFTGPGYYLQSAGTIVLFVGMIWLYVGQFV
ncbi:MAG: hypothetical protein K9N46_15620 [Candidatus Marinimicrobia bacterium]|nr:hypothetical protein [Candidatus Neomarinimicrobiota bacterium]MCF7830112.1 hypothetical protein [Candidatus Neomarinimicrobiota bacterium]MCF7882159.1 hypothetical protein [Candidatus Neomarinimicrobiota bacterium]